jgi:hypothetical protein
MKERSIIFSGPMVRAILDGTKTQMRRVVSRGFPADFSLHGVPGDRLNVKDATWIWCRKVPNGFMPHWASRITLEITNVRVQRLQEITAEDALEEGVMQSPTWDSDTHKAFQKQMDGLPFTDEQVAAMSETEHHAAVEQTWKNYAVSGFAALWDSINGKKYPWDSNPCVRALTFKRVQP